MRASITGLDYLFFLMAGFDNDTILRVCHFNCFTCHSEKISVYLLIICILGNDSVQRYPISFLLKQTTAKNDINVKLASIMALSLLCLEAFCCFHTKTLSLNTHTQTLLTHTQQFETLPTA